MKSAVKIEIEGIVQGVGFRPFVHRLAERFQLNGYVFNTSEGVAIHAEGERSKIERFIKASKQMCPPWRELHNCIGVRTSGKMWLDFPLKKALDLRNKVRLSALI